MLVVSGVLGAGLGAAVGPIDVGGGHDPAPATAPGEPGSDPTDQPDHGGHGSGADTGHDLDEPFEVPEIGAGEGGS